MLLSWTFFLSCISGLTAVPLLMSWTTNVKLFDDTDIANISSVISTNTRSVAVDYHYRRGEFYFSESSGRIYRAWLRPKENTLKKPIIIAEVKLCDGLAVDWVGDNLYWTDVTARKVEVSTLDGLYRRTLFNSSHGVEKPRAIVLDPSKGLMFWSDWGSMARVESSGMDGGDKQTVVSSNLFWPNGLTLDLNNKKLYVLDGFLSTMSSCNYDGSNLIVIKKSPEILQQAFALTFYGNKLYWTSWRQHTLFSMDVTSGSTQSVYKHTGAMVVERMMGVKVVHPSLQNPVSDNPCDTGGCSYRCLVSRSLSASCICPYGFILQSDKKTCVEEGQFRVCCNRVGLHSRVNQSAQAVVYIPHVINRNVPGYLVASWRKMIRRYDLHGGNEEALIDATAAAIAIDYHLKKNLIFWSDIEEHRIYRAPLEQLNNKTVLLVTEQCDGLAVDWVHDVIYWTDTFHNTLEVAELDGTKRKTIISENLDEPRAIVIDPSSRYIFWSDWGTSAKIERAVLDGSERQAIISNNVIWPNGMTLDLMQKKVYWVDGKLASISSCDYNGSNRKTLLGTTIFSFQPFGITLLQDKIYWTDWKTQSLFRIDRGNHIQIINKLANYSVSIFMRPNGVRAVHSSLQPEGENSCASINCRDICLGSADPSQGHCMGELEEDPDIDVRMGVPAELTSVSYNDSVVLTWSGKNPTLAVISVQCIEREGCTLDKRCSESKAQLQVFTNQNTFTITGLLPATKYSVDFKSSEHNEIVQLVTKNSEYPEIPKITSVNVDDNIVKVKWDPVDTCIPGFDSYHYKVFKNTPSQDVALEGHTNDTEILLDNLEPGMNFSINVYTLDEHFSATTSFTTKADESEEDLPCRQETFLCDGKKDCPDGSDENVTLCAGLESVTVYKKSNSAVYFRCQVQNRTVKQLEKFVVDYSLLDSGFTEEFEVAAEPCIVWPESYCFDLSGLTTDKVYNFSVAAALKDKSVGNHIEVSASTKEEASGPPEDIKVVSYTPTSVLIEWKHPNQSNGIIKSFIINIHEVEMYEKEKCCTPFPIFESPTKEDEAVYIHEFAGFQPATTYAVSIAAKNIYVGASTTIDASTPPSPMDILRQPNVQVSSLPALSWRQPEEDPLADLPQYHDLIKSYLLLLLPTKGDVETTSDLGSLQPVLESKIGSGFKVLWHKNKDDEEAFKQPITLEGLERQTEYQLAWVQVSQYKDAYGIDHILSNHFTAV